MTGLLNGIAVCSPETYSRIWIRWPRKWGKLTPDVHCPNHTKLKGRGRKKLYAVVYVCREDKMDTYLIENVYDWKNK